MGVQSLSTLATHATTRNRKGPLCYKQPWAYDRPVLIPSKKRKFSLSY